MKAVFLVPDPGEGEWGKLIDLRALEMIQALKNLGVCVLTLPADQLVYNHESAYASIEQFEPDFITGVNYNYMLLATLCNDDLLNYPAPLVALWDDPLGAMTNYAERKIWFWERESLERSIIDSASRDWQASLNHPVLFRSLFDRPNLIHVSWDTGHTRAVRELGLAQHCRIHWHPVATYRPFLNMGARQRPFVRDVAFCGNIYSHTLAKREQSLTPELASLVHEICTRKERDLSVSVWDLLNEACRRRTEETRHTVGLHANRQPFWESYQVLAWYALNSRVRKAILGSCNHNVSIFGMFADPDSVRFLAEHGNLSFEGCANHFTGLPEVFATTRINICISNGLVFQGTPSKLIDCLASGGFALCDPKEDLVRFFGPDVEEIFFRDAEELNEKVGFFLARPERRREIAAALRERILQSCTTEKLFESVVSAVEGSAQPPCNYAPIYQSRQS